MNEERKFGIMLIFVWTPIAFLLSLILYWDKLIENNLILPMIIALPFGIFFSYLIYIKGICDEEFFKGKHQVKK